MKLLNLFQGFTFMNGYNTHLNGVLIRIKFKNWALALDYVYFLYIIS